MRQNFSIFIKSIGLSFLVLFFGSTKKGFSQSDSNIEISKDYSTFSQFEFSGLNKKEAMAATAMFFGGVSEDDLTDLCPEDLKADYEKYSMFLQYRSYGKALKNSWNFDSYMKLNNNRRVTFSVLDLSKLSDSQIRLNVNCSGVWRSNSTQYKNDIITMSILISVNENQVIFKPEKGNYSYSKYSKTLETYLDKSKTFDDIFNKKGKPKFLLREDFKNINRAVNKFYDAYKGSFGNYSTKKINLDREIRSVLNERRKQDSIERVQQAERRRKDSIEQAERQRKERVRDSINSLFTGIVVGENFYDGDHTIEIVKITRRGDDTLYGYERNKETYYLQSGENDQYSILEKNGLNNNGENITGTYVKGRWAKGKVLIEEYDEGGVHTSTKSVPRIIEIEPVVDENTPKFTKPSGIWTGKFTETKYRKNKMRGEWNVIVANNGIVRGVATSYYVRIKRGREYERTRTDEISGVLSPNGKISLKTDDGAIFTGQIIGNSVSGKWVNGTNLGGSFSGKKENY